MKIRLVNRPISVFFIAAGLIATLWWSATPTRAMTRSVAAAVVLDIAAQRDFVRTTTYDSVSDRVVEIMGELPAWLKIDDHGVFHNGWGGTIVIEPGANPARAVVRFTGVPRSACPAFTTRVMSRVDKPTDVSIDDHGFIHGDDRGNIAMACGMGGDRVSVAFMGPPLPLSRPNQVEPGVNSPEPSVPAGSSGPSGRSYSL